MGLVKQNTLSRFFPLKFKSTVNTGENECWPPHSARRVRDATRRMSAMELVCAAPSQQHYNLALNWSSSSRPSSRCCWQHLEEQGRGGTSTARGGTRATRRISSVAAASAPSQQQKQATAVSRDHERSTGRKKHHRAAPRRIIGQPLDGFATFWAVTSSHKLS